jgi:hypothetical protein
MVQKVLIKFSGHLKKYSSGDQIPPPHEPILLKEAHILMSSFQDLLEEKAFA